MNGICCVSGTVGRNNLGFSWPVLDRQQGIDWIGVVENGGLSPTLPLDRFSSNAEYLERFGRSAG